MAKICSFCKREVTNGVCCDYCGTPLIFSEDDGAPKDKAENKAEQKSEALYKNSGDNVNFSADTEGEEIARREIKSGIEALYEQSRHLRENKDDSVFGAEKSNAESIVKNGANHAGNGNSDDLGKIKINIYNSEFADGDISADGETRVISAEDIAMIKRQVEINRENAVHARENEENSKACETGADSADESAEHIEETEKIEENEISENIENTENVQRAETDGNDLTAEENEPEDDEDDDAPSETYLRYMAAAQNTQPVRKEDTKLAKFLKWVLGIMFLLGLVSLFFPALNPAETSDTMSFSIVDAVLLVTTFAGMCFAFFEKKGIRKFIYGIMFSVVFLAVYLVFARPVPPKNTKQLCTLAYLAVMLIVSVFGHMASGGTKYDKLQVWFDTFTYLALVADLFSIALCIMLYFVMPSDISGAMLPYVIAVLAVSVFALAGIILMLRRKIAGANMYLVSAIALIIVSMLAYNKIINTIGYYSSVISLMSTIGSGYSKFIALCVAYPIFMYMLLSFLKGKGEVSAKN